MFIRKYSFAENTSVYYSCPFEDVLAGNIRWKEEFNTEDLYLMWREYIEERAKKGLVTGWSAGY